MHESSSPFKSVCDLQVSAVAIITKKDDPRALSHAKRVSAWLQARGIGVELNAIRPGLDLVIVLGGDGTLLHIAEQAARYSIPVTGINLGNLGFLTELAAGETEDALERIIAGKVVIENRMMLKTRLVQGDGPQPYRYALNDIVVNKNTLDRLLHLATRAGEEYITTYKADGLIFSTATGSTAYNLSAGGPLVHPGLATILVTPICPFMLSSRPILLPASNRITAEFVGCGAAECAQVIVDGRPSWEMQEGDTLEIEPAEHALQLIASSTRGYFSILRNKLHWGSGDEPGH